MTRKKIFILSGIIIIALLGIVLVIFFLLDKSDLKESENNSKTNTDPYSFEKRMKFSIPENAKTTILEMEISEEQENVYMKFTIPESDVDKFIETLNTAGYYEDSEWGDEYDFIPHPERASDKWDMDYEKLERIYYGFNTRISSKYKHRLHIYMYFLKPENETVTIYLAYNG